MINCLGACDVDLKAPVAIVNACKAIALSIVGIVSALLKQLQFSGWLFINSKFDDVQRQYYQITKIGVLDTSKSYTCMGGCVYSIY